MSEVVWQLTKSIAPIFILILLLMLMVVIIKFAFLILKNKIENNFIEKCPKCGGKLQNKKGKYGNFIGCSNFPNCEYTRNIDK